MSNVLDEKLKLKPDIIGTSKRGNAIYSINPFCTEFTVKVKKKNLTVAKAGHFEDEDGDEISATTLAKIHLVDKEEFVKIYTSNIKNFFDLSKTAIKVFTVLMRAVQKDSLGKDEVYFNLGTATEYYNQIINDKKFSKTIYSKGINELIKNNFIAESPKQYVFYFNPNLFFNGDRLRFVQEFRKKESFKKAEKKYLQNQYEQGNLDLDLEN